MAEVRPALQKEEILRLSTPFNGVDNRLSNKKKPRRDIIHRRCFGLKPQRSATVPSTVVLRSCVIGVLAASAPSPAAVVAYLLDRVQVETSRRSCRWQLLLRATDARTTDREDWCCPLSEAPVHKGQGAPKELPRVSRLVNIELGKKKCVVASPSRPLSVTRP